VNTVRHWFVVCTSSNLGQRPLARRLLDRPLVVFRADDGRPVAALDRCPHRNMPLSEATLVDGGLRCAYHGWTFDLHGRCVRVPALDGRAESRARDLVVYPTQEQDGRVWVWADPDSQPTVAPVCPDPPPGKRIGWLRHQWSVEAGLSETLENILDVPHTAFLHRGWFRGRRPPVPVTALVRRYPDRVEAEYLGEPRPGGLAARLLAPGGGTLSHVDRFLLPSVAQVEYRLGGRGWLLATALLTPETERCTRIYGSLQFRVAVPAWLLKPLLIPIAWVILRQDSRALQLQTRNQQRFGGAHYSSTEVDVLGPEIARLLRSDPRHQASEQLLAERELRLWL
jgi:nitrite reductase/ring-hydroxylating ferredoxin subunit